MANICVIGFDRAVKKLVENTDFSYNDKDKFIYYSSSSDADSMLHYLKVKNFASFLNKIFVEKYKVSGVFQATPYNSRQHGIKVNVDKNTLSSIEKAINERGQEKSLLPENTFTQNTSLLAYIMAEDEDVEETVSGTSKIKTSNSEEEQILDNATRIFGETYLSSLRPSPNSLPKQYKSSFRNSVISFDELKDIFLNLENLYYSGRLTDTFLLIRILPDILRDKFNSAEKEILKLQIIDLAKKVHGDKARVLFKKEEQYEEFLFSQGIDILAFHSSDDIFSYIPTDRTGEFKEGISDIPIDEVNRILARAISLVKRDFEFYNFPKTYLNKGFKESVRISRREGVSFSSIEDVFDKGVKIYYRRDPGKFALENIKNSNFSEFENVSDSEKDLFSNTSLYDALSGTRDLKWLNKYLIYRILSSLSTNDFLKGLSRKLKIDRIAIVNFDKFPPVFVQNGILHVNVNDVYGVASLFMSIKERIDKGENIDMDIFIDTLLSEELIHMVVDRVSTKEEMEKAAQELEENSQILSAVNRAYNINRNSHFSNLKGVSAVHEYIRMLIQRRVVGNTTENELSTPFIKRILNKVLEFISDMVAKLFFINRIYDKALKFIESDQAFDLEYKEGIFTNEVLGTSSYSGGKGEEIVKKIIEIDKDLVLNEDEKKYYYKGTKVPKRATDVAKVSYERSKRRKGIMSDTDDKYKEALSKIGTAVHEDIAHILSLHIDEKTKKLRPSPLKDQNYVPKSGSVAAYIELKNYIRGLLSYIESKNPGSYYLYETKIYNPSMGMAGTVDFIFVSPEGEVGILDWKTLNLNLSIFDDIPYYNINAWNVQMEQYRKMLSHYGISSSNIIYSRMIPIITSLNYLIDGIKLNTVTIGKYEMEKETANYLMAVPTFSEEKDPELKKIVDGLNEIYSRTLKSKYPEEQRKLKFEELNAIRSAIRHIIVRKNFVPFVQYLNSLENKLVNFIESYEKDWKNAAPSEKTELEKSKFYEDLLFLKQSLLLFKDVDIDIFQYLSNSKDAQLYDSLSSISNRMRLSFKKLEGIEKSYIENFIAAPEGEADKIFSPEKVIRGIARLFSTTSLIQMSSVRIFFKKISRADFFIRRRISEEMQKIEKLKNDLEAWASSNGVSLKEALSKIRDEEKNVLISRYKRDFYIQLKEAINKKDRKWIMENVDIEALEKFLQENVDKEVEYIERIAILYSWDEKKKELKIKQAKENYSIKGNAIYNYEVVKKFPKAIHETEEWKFIHMPQNAALLNLYEYIIKRNRDAANLGYISHQRASVFLPFVSRNLIETLGSSPTSALNNMSRALTIDENTVGFGKIDKLSNEIVDEIPIYFTNPTKDFTKDLFNALTTFNMYLVKYEEYSKIEGQIKALLEVEKNKKSIMTSIFNNPVFEEGSLKYSDDNEQNAKLLRAMVRNILYGQKYVRDESFDQALGKIGKILNPVLKKLGIETIPENNVVSLTKSVDVLNRVFQLTKLGLNPLTAISNFLGGTLNSFIASSKYFTKAEYMASEFAILPSYINVVESKKFIALLNKFFPLLENYQYKYEKNLSSFLSNKFSIQEFLMFLMRHSDLYVQTSIFHAFIKNTVVLEDGRIVNAREYVKSLPKYQNKYKSRNSRTLKQIESEYENDVKKLIEERSILKLGEVDEKTGEFVLPVKENSEDIIRIRNIIQGIVKDSLGNLSDNDNRLINMNIIGKSFMIFKNWMPRLIDMRFGDLKYNTAKEAYEWGRIRSLAHLLITESFLRIDNVYHVIAGTDKGIKILSSIYQRKREEYEKITGRPLEMSEADFADMVRENISSTVKELVILLSMLALYFKMLALSNSDDDDDMQIRNIHDFTVRAIDKVTDELRFFYDPTSFTSFFSSGLFPSVSYLSNLKKVLYNTSKEVYGIVIQDDELLEDNKVIKYWMKSFPITSQGTWIIPIFSPELAKELGIKISKESRPIIN